MRSIVTEELFVDIFSHPLELQLGIINQRGKSQLKGNLITIRERIPLGPGVGKTAVLGDQYTFKAAQKDTSGAYALCEIVTPAAVAVPPPHIHEREDEAFYVLEGEMTF